MAFKTTGESMKPNNDIDFTAGGTNMKISFELLTGENGNNFYSITSSDSRTDWTSGENIKSNIIARLKRLSK